MRVAQRCSAKSGDVFVFFHCYVGKKANNLTPTKHTRGMQDGSKTQLDPVFALFYLQIFFRYLQIHFKHAEDDETREDCGTDVQTLRHTWVGAED